MKIDGDGPFRDNFEVNLEGVVLREIITYRVVNGMMRKEVATRNYSEGDNYNDSTSVTPLPFNK